MESVKAACSKLVTNTSGDIYESLPRALLHWFAGNARELPWRKTYAPYAVWVSEIMLQQTQMDRAVSYFVRWMERFPTLESVAAANPDDLLKGWEGLGYYSRVRNMQKAAQILLAEHGGAFPASLEALRALPGIGDYTAGAILSLAFNVEVPAVDANVERVFSRLFDIDLPVKSSVAADAIRQTAARLIPRGRARDFNQALMELGALVCAKKPRCHICPIAAFCQAKRLGIPHERPVPGKKAPYETVAAITGILIHNGLIFLQKRLDSGVWAGFWEFPGGKLEPGEQPEDGVVREFLEETEFSVRVTGHLGLVRHAYTRYRIVLHCFVCALDGKTPLDGNGLPLPVLHTATEYRWARSDELEHFTLPAGHRKLTDTWMDRLKQKCAGGDCRAESFADAQGTDGFRSIPVE